MLRIDRIRSLQCSCKVMDLKNASPSNKDSDLEEDMGKLQVLHCHGGTVDEIQDVFSLGEKLPL